MFNIKSLLSTVLAVLLVSSIQSLADTFVVTNLNDPGAGSLRQAITNSNLSPGADDIVFEEGLEGTIVLNLGSLEIQDDLTITGPGADRITIDADGKSSIIINDFDDEINRVVKISGISLINGLDRLVCSVSCGAIFNIENLTVDTCRFINNGDAYSGGAIDNQKILTVYSCLFDNNSAIFGGAINNKNSGVIVMIMNSEFRDNNASSGGAIQNAGVIELISNSNFTKNNNSAIDNSGTIREISRCTFEANTSTFLGRGGAILNGGIIENIVNSTFTRNGAVSGNAIWNAGIINISFTTIANNPLAAGSELPPIEEGGIDTVEGGVTRVRNSIIASNSPINCFRFLEDLGGNYSDDFSCGLTGDGSEIILGPLANNGGPTETMALLGGDPIDGATVNCDALNQIGNPTGIPIGTDQRYFPRPFGTRCDSGAFESQSAASVTITKVTDPPDEKGFEFESDGFSSLEGCGLRGDGDEFVMDDGDSMSCIVPQGGYLIKENIPQGYELAIICLEAPDNIVINNETGEIEFTILDAGSDVDCVFTNVKIEEDEDGGGCTLAPAGVSNSIPLYLFIPVLILIRRFVRRYRS